MTRRPNIDPDSSDTGIMVSGRGHSDRLAALADVPGPVLMVCVGLLYAALAQYVIWLNDPVNAGAGYWPAAGVTLAALLLVPRRRWGWVLTAVAVAEIAGDVVHGYPLAVSAWWAAANVVEPLLAGLVLGRVGHGGRLSPLRDLGWFLAVGVVGAPFVGAAIGSIASALEYGGAYADIVAKWWAGDGLGVLVIAPLFLALRETPVVGRSRLEVAALPAAVLAMSVLAFRNWHPEWDAAMPYVALPLMMWVSVRLGPRGAALAGFVVAEVANLATALGYGPFTLVAGRDVHAVTVLQVFLASALTSGLVIAALVRDGLERSRQYERQRAVAHILQAAVRPDRLPSSEDVDLAVRYQPASDEPGIHVGGDWYDVFELPGGELGFVVGDVAGHDLRAAVVMGRVRNALRSLLMQLEDPAEAMAAMDAQLVNGESALATAICGVWQRGELRWANAGHPPPLMAPAGGSPRYLDHASGPMLGVGIGSRTYDTHRVGLGVGDTVVVFTDGLVEHRNRPLDEGLDHVAELVGAASAYEPDSLCDLLIAEGLRGHRREDDCCVLVVRRSA